MIYFRYNRNCWDMQLMCCIWKIVVLLLRKHSSLECSKHTHQQSKCIHQSSIVRVLKMQNSCVVSHCALSLRVNSSNTINLVGWEPQAGFTCCMPNFKLKVGFWTTLWQRSFQAKHECRITLSESNKPVQIIDPEKCKHWVCVVNDLISNCQLSVFLLTLQPSP